jgi:hypothetical protein
MFSPGKTGPVHFQIKPSMKPSRHGLFISGSGRFLFAFSGRAEFLDQGIHIVDFFQKGAITYRTNGRQSEPADFQTTRLHQLVYPVKPFGQGGVGPIVRAFFATGHDDNATDTFPETVKIEVFRK